MAQDLALAYDTYGNEDPCVADVLKTYGTVLRQLKRKREAKALEKRAKLIEKNIGQRDYSRLTTSVMSSRAPPAVLPRQPRVRASNRSHTSFRSPAECNR
jgi:hypothetical protein